MAKIANQTFAIQISKLVKDSDSETISVLDSDLESAIVELIENVIASGHIVEIIKD